MMSLLIKRFLLPSKLIFQHTFIPFGRNLGGGGCAQFNQTMDRCFNALKKKQPLFFFTHVLFLGLELSQRTLNELFFQIAFIWFQYITHIKKTRLYKKNLRQLHMTNTFNQL